MVPGKDASTYGHNITARVEGGKLDQNGAVKLQSFDHVRVKLLTLDHRAVTSELILGLLDSNLEALSVVNDESSWFLMSTHMPASVVHADDYLRFALTISVRHGRPSIMMPLPRTLAT